MLKAACSNRKLKSFLIGTEFVEAIDKSACKGISSSDAVDDVVHLVLFADNKFFSVIERCCPEIDVCALAFSQSNGNFLNVRILLEKAVAQFLIVFLIELAAFDIALTLKTQGLLAVFFVRYDDVCIKS